MCKIVVRNSYNLSIYAKEKGISYHQISIYTAKPMKYARSNLISRVRVTDLFFTQLCFTINDRNMQML